MLDGRNIFMNHFSVPSFFSSLLIWARLPLHIPRKIQSKIIYAWVSFVSLSPVQETGSILALTSIDPLRTLYKAHSTPFGIIAVSFFIMQEFGNISPPSSCDGRIRNCSIFHRFYDWNTGKRASHPKFKLIVDLAAQTFFLYGADVCRYFSSPFSILKLLGLSMRE